MNTKLNHEQSNVLDILKNEMNTSEQYQLKDTIVSTIYIQAEEIPNKKIELRTKRAKKNNPVFDSIAEKIELAKQNYEQGGILWNQKIEEFEIYDRSETGDGKYTSACPKWVIDKYLEDFWDIKFEKYFENVICPVLMLPSEEEWKSKEIKAGIENFQKLLKSSQVVVITEGRHAYVAFQYPLEFSKVIQAFHKEIEQY